MMAGSLGATKEEVAAYHAALTADAKRQAVDAILVRQKAERAPAPKPA